MKYFKYVAYGKAGVYESVVTMEKEGAVVFVLNEYGCIEKPSESLAIKYHSEKKELTEEEYLNDVFMFLAYKMLYKAEVIDYFEDFAKSKNKVRQ